MQKNGLVLVQYTRCTVHNVIPPAHDRWAKLLFTWQWLIYYESLHTWHTHVLSESVVTYPNHLTTWQLMTESHLKPSSLRLYTQSRKPQAFWDVALSENLCSSRLSLSSLGLLMSKSTRQCCGSWIFIFHCGGSVVSFRTIKEANRNHCERSLEVITTSNANFCWSLSMDGLFSRSRV